MSCKETSKNNPQTQNSTTAIAGSESEVSIDLEKVLGEGKQYTPVNVQIKYDHNFKSSKRFKAFYLNALIDSFVRISNFDTTKALIVFDCTDGYKPMMDFSKISGHSKGYIAFKDLDQHGEDWADSIASKFKPYCLSWDDVGKLDDSYIWPYGITTIRLVSTQQEYKTIFPFNNASLKDGFYLFRDNCIKCHSMNKIGGSIGVEFNVPKNITEYWQDKDILSFVKAPSSYRYNSRMPAITQLKDEELIKVIDYIKFMKKHKID